MIVTTKRYHPKLEVDFVAYGYFLPEIDERRLQRKRQTNVLGTKKGISLFEWKILKQTIQDNCQNCHSWHVGFLLRENYSK